MIAAGAGTQVLVSLRLADMGYIFVKRTAQGSPIRSTGGDGSVRGCRREMAGVRGRVFRDARSD